MEGYLSHTFKDKDGNDFTVPFFIGSYALENSLIELDASLSDLEDLVNKKLLPLIRLYMFYSAEYQAHSTGQAFTFTRIDAYNWIDQTGGIEGEFFFAFSKAVFKDLGLTTNEPEKAEQKKSLKKVG